MSSIDHLRSCSFCQRQEYERIMSTNAYKPTVKVKEASAYDYNRQKKLAQLGAIIKGASYIEQDPIKPAGYYDRQKKLRELGKIVRDYSL